MLCHKCGVNKDPGHSDTLATWLRTALGRSLIQSEYDSVAKLLPGLFGPVAIQVSAPGFRSFVASSDAVFNYTASITTTPGEEQEPVHLLCLPEQLPIEARSVGLVILPHVLEFSEYPHQILREVERVLAPEGHLVLVGFNPVSLWGLMRIFRRRRAPWNGRFSSVNRVKDWLQLLNFELVAGKMIYHRPPVQSERVRRRLGFLENAGDRWWPLGAAVYAVVARKREIGVTPLHPAWKKRSQLNPGLARPVAKVHGITSGRIEAG